MKFVKTGKPTTIQRLFSIFFALFLCMGMTWADESWTCNPIKIPKDINPKVSDFIKDIKMPIKFQLTQSGEETYLATTSLNNKNQTTKPAGLSVRNGRIVSITNQWNHDISYTIATDRIDSTKSEDEEFSWSIKFSYTTDRGDFSNTAPIMLACKRVQAQLEMEEDDNPSSHLLNKKQRKYPCCSVS